jgi:hypothetical protein
LILITKSLLEERPSYKEPSSPVGWMQSGLAASVVTPSQKKIDGDGNQLVNAEPFIYKSEPSKTTSAKGVLNNGEHTLIPVMAKMIHSAVWDYLSLRPSYCLSVRAKRGIWSKRVLIRKIGNFSFSVH